MNFHSSPRDKGNVGSASTRSTLARGLEGWSGFFDDHPRLLAVFFGALTVFPLLFWTQFWGTNDDAGLSDIAGGTDLGSPSANLIFLHVAMGLLLKGLYHLSTSVNWYYMMHMVIFIVSFTAIAYVVLQRQELSRLLRIALLTLVFFPGVVVLMQSLQFTQTAFVAAAAGAAIWLGMSGTWKTLVLGTPFWLLAYLVRFSSFQGAVAISLPFLLVAAFRNGPKWLLIGFILLGGIYLGGDVFEQIYYYGDDARQEYVEFNEARGQLHSTPRLTGLESDGPLLEQIGWSPNDATAFKSWFFADADIFETADLETILEAHGGVDGQSWTEFKGAVNGTYGRTFVAAALVALTVLFVTGGYLGVLASFGGGLMWLGLMAYLGETSRIPARVFLPTVFLLTICAATTAVAPVKFRIPKVLSGFLLLIVSATALYGASFTVPQAHEWDRYFGEQRQITEGVQDQLGELKDDPAIFTWLYGFRAEFLSPSAAPNRRPFTAISFGWPIRSPDWNATLRRNGIDSLSWSIGTDPDVLLLMRDSDKARQLMETFLEEHHGLVGIMRPYERIRGRQGVMLYDLLVSANLDSETGVVTGYEGDRPVERHPIEVTGSCDLLHSEDGFVTYGGTVTPATGVPLRQAYVFAGDALNHIVLVSPVDTALAVPEGSMAFEFSVGVAEPDRISVAINFDDNAVGVLSCG
jgi:hypothetical protein